jgi:dipeptidyl aminopeptidase/acylaminoacyl peptidase
MTSRWITTAFLLAALPLAAQQRRTVTHDDVWLMQRVGAPTLSPDGRWAVFGVTQPSYAEGEQSSDLWLVPTDGSAPPRQLTHTRGGEGGVAWSPDGRRLAFGARREGDDAGQIYVLDVAAGGEAHRVTSLSTGARAPVWRPDGRALLFTSDVYPSATTDSANRAAAAERRARKWNARVYDGAPTRFWDRWLDERRPHLFVQPLEPAGPARDLLAGTELAGDPGFGGQLGSGGEGLDAVWTPDGSGIVFVATDDRDEWARADVVQSLWLVPAEGGEPRRLTPGPDSYSDPRFRPDGRALYARVEPATEFVYNHDRLAMWPWPALDRRTVLSAAFDGSVGTYGFTPDGRSVLFLAGREARQRLFRVPAGGGAVTEVGRLTAGSLGGLDVAGTARAPVIVGTWESAMHPPEIVRIDPATGRTTPLSRFNAERVAAIDWQPVREFWFTDSKGARIHTWIVAPAGFDSTRTYPLFTVIHGGPHSAWGDAWGIRWNYHLLASPGYVLLLTNYTGSTTFGERFAQAIQGDPLDGPGREINEAVDAAIRAFPFIDGDRVVAGGASYGGHLANWLAVTTTRYRALISHAGLWDLETQYATSDVNWSRERNMGGPPWEGGALWREQSPMRRAGQLRTPVLVTVGERDFRVPLNNALEFWTALQRQRVPSRLIVFPEENHWVLRGENSRFFYQEVHAWLARWLAEAGQASGN